MARLHQMPTAQTGRVKLRRIGTPNRDVKWKLAWLGSTPFSAEQSVRRSLATCDSLLLGPGARREANIGNPQFPSNRVSGRHSLNSKHQQARISSGAECSLDLLPDIRVFKLIAGEIIRAAELVCEDEARTTRAFQSLSFEVRRELVLRIWLDRNDLANTGVFDSVAIKNYGQRTV